MKSQEIKQIIGNIFTDDKGKKYTILRGELPTKLDDQFIWLKKPQKGAYKIAPLEWFSGQIHNTSGLYPLELIRTEKFIAKVVPLVQD